MSLLESDGDARSKPCTTAALVTCAARGRAPLETLPLELHYLIMADLVLADLHALLLTSRALSTIALQKLYRSVSLSLGRIDRKRTLSLLAALDHRKHLVRRVRVYNRDTTPDAMSMSIGFAVAERTNRMVAELCATGQLEAIVYSENPELARSSPIARFRVRPPAVSRAIGAAPGLKFLTLGVVNHWDSELLVSGLAATELLGFAARFDNPRHDDHVPYRPYAAGDLQAAPAAQAAAAPLTDEEIIWMPLLPPAAVVHDGVVKKVLATTQATLAVLSLDANLGPNLSAEVLQLYSMEYLYGRVKRWLGPKDLCGFFAPLSLARVTRLSLHSWPLGGAESNDLMAAFDFAHMAELRLVGCTGVRELLFALKTRGIELTCIRTLALSAPQDDLVEVLAHAIPPNRARHVFLFVEPPPYSPLLYHHPPHHSVALPAFADALVSAFGSTLRSLEIRDPTANSESWIASGVFFSEDALQRMMHAYENLTDLTITADFNEMLHTIVLTQAFTRTLDESRAHPTLVGMAEEAFGALLPRIDAYARAWMLDLVETVQLQSCARTPIHAAFDLWKDSTLRRVGITFRLPPFETNPAHCKAFDVVAWRVPKPRTLPRADSAPGGSGGSGNGGSGSGSSGSNSGSGSGGSGGSRRSRPPVVRGAAAVTVVVGGWEIGLNETADRNVNPYPANQWPRVAGGYRWERETVFGSMI